MTHFYYESSVYIDLKVRMQHKGDILLFSPLPAVCHLMVCGYSTYIVKLEILVLGNLLTGFL